ncbi:MAG: hypothetical protein HWE24_13710 [Oceanospirillaceae bacterium]|nr:hypothetical protein [Oceanospirillaceae bacterium]
MINKRSIDIRSFLFVMLAFAGNASFAGIDIVMILLPVLAILQSSSIGRLKEAEVLLFLPMALLFAALSIRAPTIGIEYSSTYFLWPLKSFALFCIISFGGKLSWPAANNLLLGFFCIFLVLIGKDVDGRLYSLFGPNMLYRLFGILLFFSIISFLEDTGKRRAASGVLAVFSIFACLLTGSSGAIILILLVALFVISKFSKGLVAIAFATAAYAISTSGALRGAMELPQGGPFFYYRIIYKINNAGDSYRYETFEDFFHRSIPFFGSDYGDFWNIWTWQHFYPHNLAVELILFYGVVGILVMIVLSLSCVSSTKGGASGSVLEVTFYVLFAASMLSGDLADNYAVISLGAALLLKNAGAWSSSRLLKNSGLDDFRGT